MGLRHTDDTTEMVFEMREDDARIGQLRADLLGCCAHAARGRVPRPCTVLDFRRMKPQSTQSANNFNKRPRARSPTEPLQRVLGKQHEFRNRRGRTRWLGALLQPVIDIARTNHDQDRVETTVLREHALEDELQLS